MTLGFQPTWLSLIPAFVALGMSFLTKEVIVALIAGIATGGLVLLLYTGSFTESSIIQEFLLPAMGSESFAAILLIYLWCLGGMIGMWEKTGGARYFAQLISRKMVKSPKQSMVLSWCISLIFHQGGTISTVLTGTTVKPIADTQRVSHEELAYLVDSTASPIATLIPFNAWPLYIGGLIVGTVPFISNTSEAYHFFFSSILFNFYAILTVSFTLLFALGWMPWIGKEMRAAQHRARTTGKLDRDGAKPLLPTETTTMIQAEHYRASLLDFILPIGLLIVMTVTPFLLWQFGFLETEHANWINAGFMIAALASMALAYIKGMAPKDILDGFTGGCKAMTIGALILGLALTLGVVTKKLGTAEYLISLCQNSLHPLALPGLLSVLCMLMSFATGTSFGTYAVVYPIALPLAYGLNPDPFFVQVCFGAVLGGALFGDQCSPISDTTILSSMFTGCDLMDHVRTQLPLALLAAGLGVLLSTGVLIFR